jgi:small conductance mechanosensitive channel
LLAVAITGLFLLVFEESGVPAQEPAGVADTTELQDSVPTASPGPGESLDEATGTLRQLAADFTGILPKVGIALALIVAASLLVRLSRRLLRRILGGWEKAEAATAMTGVIIWLLAVGVALSVIAGDARALLGSVGLLGLALSWALQTPIESFAGWLLNSFKGYYRVGDRIAVGEVFGDVYRIDALTTTVWEAGGLDKSVQGAQPTGALITFPNSEVLRANVVNYTRGFPYVWDEITVGIGNESDLSYAMEVVLGVARRVVGPVMSDPVASYRSLLARNGLAYEVAEEPEVYLIPSESWVDLTIRYLVPVRQRRKWSSLLHLEIATEIARPEHAQRIGASYPVRQVHVTERSSESRAD